MWKCQYNSCHTLSVVTRPITDVASSNVIFYNWNFLLSDRSYKILRPFSQSKEITNVMTWMKWVPNSLDVWINQRDATLLMNDLLLSINWLYMFLTITSPSSGASSHKLYNSLVCSCYQASLALVWMYIRATARLACTNIPMRSTQQLDSPDSTNIPMRYTVYEMMLLMMDWW